MVCEGTELEGLAAEDETLEALLPFFKVESRLACRNRAVRWIKDNAPEFVILWFTSTQIGINSKMYRMRQAGLEP